MSDDIVQKLGFDVSQALDALKKLDAGLAGLEARARSVANALKGLSSSSNSVVSAINKLGTSSTSTTNTVTGNLRQQTSAFQNTSAASAAAINRMTTSFELLSRIVYTQTIVRALSAFRNSVEGSLNGNIAFVKSLAEIQTLDPGSTIDQLGKEVRGLSDAFNVPLLDVAHAKYEALSNGFTSAAAQANVLNAAIKLGKTGVATTAQSLDLLSGTLNAFGDNSGLAETRAAQFFETVNLGKTVVSELSTSFGRVAPLGAELGASFEELAASLSTVTIGGVQTSEAVTQVRGALTALAKPSETMQAAFRKLGVEDGAQLLSISNDLADAFRKVTNTTDGSVEATAKLFPNVRALNAVLRLTGTGLETYESHLERIRKISTEAFNKTYQARIDTNAERVAADLNKIRNFFTDEFGAALVKSFGDATKFVGGIDTAVSAMRALIPTLELGAATATAFGTAIAFNSVRKGIGNLGVSTLTPQIQAAITALSGVGKAATSAQDSGFIALSSLEKSAQGYTSAVQKAEFATNALGLAMRTAFNAVIAFSIGSFIGDQLQQSLDKMSKDAIERETKVRELRRSGEERAARLQDQQNQETVKKLNAYLAQERRAYFDATDGAKQANQDLLNDTESTLKKVISARQAFVKDLERTAEEAAKAITSSRERQSSAEAQLADSQFTFQNARFSPGAQASRLQQQAQELASEAARQLSKASNSEALQQALSTFGRSESFAQQAQSIAQQNGSLAQQAQVQQTIESILRKKIDAEKQYQALQAKNAQLAAAAAAEESKRVTRLKQLSEIIVKGSDLFGKEGPLDSSTRQTNLRNANAALNEFFKLSTERGKIDVTTLFSFDTLRQRLNAGVTATEIKQLRANPAALDELNRQIQGAVKPIEIALKFGFDPKAFEGLSATEAFQKLADDASESVRTTASQAVARRELADVRSQIKAAQDAIGAAFQSANSSVVGGILRFPANLPGNDKLSNLKNQIGEFGQKILEAGNDANLTREQVAALAKEGEKLASEAPITFRVDVNALATAIQQLTTIVLKREELRDLEKLQPDSDNLQQRALDQLNSKLPAAVSAARQLNTFSDQTAAGMQRQASLSAQNASLLERQAAAAERLQASRAAGSIATEALGGLAHFSTGGLAKGTDNIPALLSKGEFVVNSHSAARFLPQLQAMNAGIQPSFNRPTTINNTVGDIVINADPNPRTTAREVMDLIRREQRRGTAQI